MTQSSITELDGLEGKLSVQSTAKERRGGVMISTESNRRFSYENGESYYPIAFEADWLFALDAENANDISIS